MDFEQPLLAEDRQNVPRIDTDKYWIIYFLILINSCIICILTILQIETAFLAKFDTFVFGTLISTKISFYDMCLFDNFSNSVCFKIHDKCVIKFPTLKIDFGNFENCNNFTDARNLFGIICVMQAVWPFVLILAAFGAYLLQNNSVYSQLWYKVIFATQLIIDLFVFIANIAIFNLLKEAGKSQNFTYSKDTWIIWQITILIFYAFSFVFIIFMSKRLQ